MMFDKILTEILRLKWMVFVYIIAGALIFMAYWLLSERFEWKKGYVRIFSLLYGLTLRQQIAVGMMLTRFIFVTYLIIDHKSIGLHHLLVLLLMSIAAGFVEKDFSTIAGGIVSSIAYYVIIYLQSNLISFYFEVEHYWLILAMSLLIGLFCFLYNLYNLISSYNHLIIRNKDNSRLYESFRNTKKVSWQK